MRRSTLCLFGLLLGALAARPAVASAVENPFIEPMRFDGFREVVVPNNTDVEPFGLSHSAETNAYISLQAAYYNVQMASRALNRPERLPNVADQSGHPLWIDGYTQTLRMQNLCEALLAKASRGEYDNVDRLFNDWNRPDEQMSDGNWKLAVLFKAMSKYADNTVDWLEAHENITRWRKERPQSRAAALMEAIYWYRYAWNARGSGYANSVTPEGWRLHAERLAQAEKVLAADQALTSSSPLFAYLNVVFAQALQKPRDEMIRSIKEQQTEATPYFPTYLVMATTLQPKWGGDWSLVDGFLKAASDWTNASEGSTLYARIYWMMYEQMPAEADLFRHTQASWPVMKRGFEELSVRFPHSSYWMNNYASAACLANDKDAYRSARLRMRKAVHRASWATHHSLDLCDQMLGAPAL